MAKPSLSQSLKRQLNAKEFSLRQVGAVVIFGAIALTFVLNMNMGREMGGRGYAAQVNDSYISLKDLNSETERVERSFGQMFGQLGGAQRSFMTNQALQSLIQTELVSQYSEKAHIFATDHEVSQVIVKDLPYFQESGRFRRDLYEQILASNRLTPSEFEEKVRKDRKLARIRGLMEASSTPLKLEVEKKKQLAESQVNFSYVQLEKEKIGESMQISDAEIATRLQDPAFKQRAEAAFAADSARYDVPEEVHAAHILIKSNPDKAGSDAEAKKKIDEIKAKTATEDFGKLAIQYTEDAGSKASKGDLGFFGRGKMVPDFDAVAFALKPGEVSAPVKTPFGYHLIKVIEKKPGQKAEFAAFDKQIAKLLIGEERFDQEIKVLEEKLAAKDMNGVNQQLKQMGASWQDTGPVDLGADFIPKLSSQAASAAAFQLTPEKPVSQLIRDPSGVKYIVQFKGRTQKTLEQPIVAETVVRERTTDRLTQWLEEVQKTAVIRRNPDIGAADPQSLGM